MCRQVGANSPFPLLPVTPSRAPTSTTLLSTIHDVLASLYLYPASSSLPCVHHGDFQTPVRSFGVQASGIKPFCFFFGSLASITLPSPSLDTRGGVQMAAAAAALEAARARAAGSRPEGAGEGRRTATPAGRRWWSETVKRG